MTKGFESVCVGAVLALGACSPTPPLGASEFVDPSAVLDPRTYSSPSGEFALVVDPSQRSGGGPGSYRFTRKGVEQWAGTRPWTLWEAALTDDGLVAGYAYGAGVEGGDGDSLTVVLLDAQGQARLEERSAREGFHSDISTVEPSLRGLLLDVDNDRLLVRVGEKGFSQGETWWTYSLSSGAPGARSEPSAALGNDVRAGWIRALRALPGTGLLLANWAWFDWDKDELGAVFALLDRDNEVVWRLDWPADYSCEDENARTALLDEINRQGAILAVESPGRFTLRCAKTDERVTFAVERGRGARAGWEVREVARAPYETPKSAALIAEPFAPSHVGTLVLDAVEPSSPIHDVMTFALDGAGRLGAICRSDRRFDFVLVEPSGSVRNSVELPRSPTGAWWTFDLACVGGERWVVTGSDASKGPEMAWRLDASSGRVSAIESFDAPDIAAVAALGDGGFVVVGRSNDDHGALTRGVVAFGEDGKRRWGCGGMEETHDPVSLYMPAAVTVTSDGRVVVLDDHRRALQYLSRDGEFLRTLELDDAWDRPPNHAVGLRADRDGGVIVHDFEGTPPIVRMDREGDVTASFQPRFADGKRFRLHGDVQLARDGTLWTSDGQALLALDTEGVVQRVLGAKPESEVLGQVERFVLGAAIACTPPTDARARCTSSTRAASASTCAGRRRGTSTAISRSRR